MSPISLVPLNTWLLFGGHLGEKGWEVWLCWRKCHWMWTLMFQKTPTIPSVSFVPSCGSRYELSSVPATMPHCTTMDSRTISPIKCLKKCKFPWSWCFITTLWKSLIQWAMGMKLRLLGLCDKYFYPWDHPAGPRYPFSKPIKQLQEYNTGLLGTQWENWMLGT